MIEGLPFSDNRPDKQAYHMVMSYVMTDKVSKIIKQKKAVGHSRTYTHIDRSACILFLFERRGAGYLNRQISQTKNPAFFFSCPLPCQEQGISFERFAQPQQNLFFELEGFTNSVFAFACNCGWLSSYSPITNLA